MPDRVEHWDQMYATKSSDELSWTQSTPSTSLSLISSLAGPEVAIIDIGAGTSTLVDELVARDFHDLSILDLSQEALTLVKDRLPKGSNVTFIASSVTEWRPKKTYGLWHDRAVLHFMVSAPEQAAYLQNLNEATEAGSTILLATFSEIGPEMCSGLPVKRYSKLEMEQYLGEEFVIMDSFLEEHVTPWNSTQSFRWFVVKRK